MRPPLRLLLVVTAAALLGLPAAALAARTHVSLGRHTITVSAPTARAVITRSPFRLAIEQASGAPGLAEVPNRRPRRLALAPVTDPFGTGLNLRSASTLYAPLSFLVGSEHLTQYQGGLWGGDLMDGTRHGVLYSAVRALAARRVPDGVTLTLATSDPTGRRLTMSVRAVGAGAFRVTASARPAGGVVEIGDSFASAHDEGFFGFGGRHNAVDQRGQVLSSWVSEENLDQYNHDPAMSPNGDTAAYYPQAEFFSSRPYGFLLAQPQLARFRLDVDRADAWNVSVNASSLDYIVAAGPAPTAIRTLTTLSGRQPVPARWALGPMLDRLVKNVGETTADYEAQVSADLADIRGYRLPLTAYRLEGWGFPQAGNDGLALHSFTTPQFQASVLATLRRRGIHPLLYLRPWLTPGSAPVQQGFEVRTASGQPYYTTTTTGAKIALLDFTNPAAVRFWQYEVAKVLDLGADGFMQDFGEEVLLDMHFHDGQTGVTMHNRYPVLYARATRQELAHWARVHPRRGRIFFFTRAGYSGLPGSAAYESANFPGDETTDFSHASGLGSLTSDMLGRAVDGAYGYGTDIGGYYDLTTPPTTRELFLRWAEWAVFSPVFRLHGSGLHGTHTPWSFGPATVRVYDALSRLHLRAVPLIMRLWRTADRTGMPVTRPLWLAYPHDRRARHQDQEWLLGPDLLVAPVVQRGAVARRVYLPSGCWRSATGRRWRGPRSVRVAAPLSVLPYFTRCGRRPLS